MINQVETIKSKTPTLVSTRVSIRLNMTTALPSNDLTTDPVIHQVGEVIEVDENLARQWASEQYLQCPTKMCERKGGDFLPPQYITRANYV